MTYLWILLSRTQETLAIKTHKDATFASHSAIVPLKFRAVNTRKSCKTLASSARLPKDVQCWLMRLLADQGRNRVGYESLLAIAARRALLTLEDKITCLNFVFPHVNRLHCKQFQCFLPVKNTSSVLTCTL